MPSPSAPAHRPPLPTPTRPRSGRHRLTHLLRERLQQRGAGPVVVRVEARAALLVTGRVLLLAPVGGAVSAPLRSALSLSSSSHCEESGPELQPAAPAPSPPASATATPPAPAPVPPRPPADPPPSPQTPPRHPTRTASAKTKWEDTVTPPAASVGSGKRLVLLVLAFGSRASDGQENYADFSFSSDSEGAPLKLPPESGSGAAQERAPITNAAAPSRSEPGTRHARNPGPGTTELTLIGWVAGGPSALAGYKSGARRVAGGFKFFVILSFADCRG
ncbi:Protein of unknown function [Gryllus bimaculatus]|nr:Protein of unknown function [Gryllus bimaculatus]